MRTWCACLVLVGCSSSGAAIGLADGGGGGSGAGDDASSSSPTPPMTATDAGADAAPTGALCTVTAEDVGPCPQGDGGTPVPGATCRTVTVSGCPGIESESIQATVAVVAPRDAATSRGTIVHFIGGGGEGWETVGAELYKDFLQVFVSWHDDWEQTATAGIKAGAARPASVLEWIWSEPSLHGGSRAKAFCGQGHSGGSAQLAYALTQYGLGDYLDYVNLLAGPPFARIDLGCDPSAPATADVCGVADTMRLPSKVGPWENSGACGGASAPAGDVDRWKNDSIAVGGVYAFPKTNVQFYDCTNNATSVTAESQILATLIAQTEGSGDLVAYHCYGAADSCSGEGLGPNATADLTAAMTSMTTGCVPRH